MQRYSPAEFLDLCMLGHWTQVDKILASINTLEEEIESDVSYS